MRLCSRLAPAVALVAGAAGCESPATQLVVVVDTDYAVPGEMGIVRARVLDGEGGEVSSAEFTLVGEDGGETETRFRVPFSFAVVPIDDDPGRRVTVEVDGLTRTEGFLVGRRARTGFVEGETLRLPMFLTSACEGVTCPEGQTCAEGGCESEEVPPESLRVVRPGEELFRDAGGDAGMDGGGMDGGMDGGRLDAGTDSGFDGGCMEEVSCDDSTCSCDTSCCHMTCDVASHCDPHCTRDFCSIDGSMNDDLQASCAMGATCRVDARGTSNAFVRCTMTSSCEVDCRSSSSCEMACNLGSRCLLRCEGSSDCRMSGCTGGALSCPGMVIVCNRECP